MSTPSRALPRRLLSLALIAAGLGAASTASAACTAGTWVARSNEAGMPPVRYETAHFAFRWNGDGVASADVRAAGEHLEMVWDTFINRLQFPEPSCNSTTKYKASLHLDPGFGLSGGVTGSGGMGMWMAPGGLRDHWGLAHELTHIRNRDTQLMVIAIVFAGIFAFFGDMVIRSWDFPYGWAPRPKREGPWGESSSESSSGWRGGDSDDKRSSGQGSGAAILAIVIASNYTLGTAARMGPGYFPRILGILLIVLGVVIALRALRVRGEAMPRFRLRPLVVVLGSVVLFGLIVLLAEIVWRAG